MRWWPAAWRRRRPPSLPAYADDGTLPVVGGSDDPARADSAVVAEMAERGVDVAAPLLVRHHLRLPDELAVTEAGRLLAVDGYRLVAEEHGEQWRVRASRVQVLTGLAAAQERSRMAGLAQRLGGAADGWDACAPPPGPPCADR